MNTSLKVRNKLILLSFISYIFLWGLEIYNTYFLRYFIFIPFILSFIYRDYVNKIDTKKYLIVPIFLLSHYVFVNYINSSPFLARDIFGIIFLCIIIYTVLIYKDLLISNFKSILKIYFSLLILSSIYYDRSIYVGSCGSNFFEYFQILNLLKLSKGFFIENSHLAMMNIAALMSSVYIYLKEKDKMLMTLIILALIVNIYNLSTTFILGLIVCSAILFFLTKEKFYKKILILISLFCLAIFLYSNNCSKKISKIDYENIKNERIFQKNSAGLTSSIYERSIILSLKTLKNNPLGWGFDGSIKAVEKLLNDSKNKQYKEQYQLNHLFWKLNLRDALGNLFKLIIEFGYLSFILIFFFINYIKKGNLNGYKIFIISLFVVQLFRGTGYINGGFMIAFTEIFLSNYLILRMKHK